MTALKIEGGRQAGRTFTLAANLMQFLKANPTRVAALITRSSMEGRIVLDYLYSMSEDPSSIKRVALLASNNHTQRYGHRYDAYYIDNAEFIKEGDFAYYHDIAQIDNVPFVYTTEGYALPNSYYALKAHEARTRNAQSRGTIQPPD